MELIGHVKEFMEACISSKVRPLVSGTSFATNITVKPHTAENMKNVPATPIKMILSAIKSSYFF